MEIIQNLELKCIDDMIWCEKEMYDLFISVGDACRVAHHLQKCSLRGEAYPLDWHMEYSLDTVIDLFETDFEDFFAEIEEIGEGQGANRKIVDVKNQIVSIHYFQMERPLEEAQNEFCEKMKKRFFRLNERLKNAGRVMLCRKGTESTETLIDFLKRFSVFYPHLEIKMLSIKNDSNLLNDEYYEREIIVSDKLKLEEWIINDNWDKDSGMKYGWRGNSEAWNRILSRYRSRQIEEMLNVIRGDVIIYGAGKKCLELIDLFNRYDVFVRGIAVTSRENNPTFMEGVRVSLIDDYERKSEIVISVKDLEEQIRIKNLLMNKGFKNILVYKDCKVTRF